MSRNVHVFFVTSATLKIFWFACVLAGRAYFASEPRLPTFNFSHNKYFDKNQPDDDRIYQTVTNYDKVWFNLCYFKFNET